MGLLASAIEQGAPADATRREAGPEDENQRVGRCWRLWREAERHKTASDFASADAALRASDEIARTLEWTHGTSPIWYVEAEGLRGAMLHDDGEHAAAAEILERALRGWMYVGAALDDPEAADPGFARAVHDCIAAMVVALAGQATLAAYASGLDRQPLDAAIETFTIDRFVPQIAEVAARTIGLTGRVRSFGEARRLVNEVLAVSGRWQLPSWDPIRFEMTLRLSLASAATEARRFLAALGQTDDALALAQRLAPGRERDVAEAQLYSNRGGELLALGRAAVAVGDYERAQERFQLLGMAQEALRTRFGALRAREQVGERVALATLKSLLTETERAAEVAQQDRGAFMHDLEILRMWYLALLAERGTDDLEEVVSLIEMLRGDRPHMRDGADAPDPVVAHLCRPFTVLGARLAAMQDTVLLVLEPSLGSVGEVTNPPVVLTISSSDTGRARWHLASGEESMHDAMMKLLTMASRERELLNTRELPLRHPASAELCHAASAAWLALPSGAREAVLAARTVLCMPSPVAGLDRLPLELLRHDGGWLGVTHVVARCPSFQYLESLVAPNSHRRDPTTRATVVQIAPAEDLGVLGDAEADAEIAMRASSMLGLEPELRHVSTVDEATRLFADAALVHYVGHGFASELGEWLPLSADTAVTPSEIAWPKDQDAPVVFFNACLLGRVRHVSGGRQRGWAVTLLLRRAPAVIGALASVPDNACAQVAQAIYRGAWKAPLGEAMRLARERLDADGYHPLIAGAYVLHGDPHAMLSRAADPALPRATAQTTTRWPALLTRFLATRSATYRDQLVVALDDAPADVRSDLCAWALGEGGTSRWPDLIHGLLRTDAEGAGAVRVVLGTQRLDANGEAANAVEELQAAYLSAAALEDTYAMAYLLVQYRSIVRSAYPGEDAALIETAEALFDQLEADRSLLRPLRDALAVQPL